jgi:hypothetical protein
MFFLAGAKKIEKKAAAYWEGAASQGRVKAELGHPLSFTLSSRMTEFWRGRFSGAR